MPPADSSEESIGRSLHW